MNSRQKSLIKILEDRIRNAEKLISTNATNRYTVDVKDEFFKRIAFFVHQIHENDQTKYLFYKLIDVNEEHFSSNHFSQLKTAVSRSIQEIGHTADGITDLSEQIAEAERQRASVYEEPGNVSLDSTRWVNPYLLDITLNNIFITTNELLTKFKNDDLDFERMELKHIDGFFRIIVDLSTFWPDASELQTAFNSAQTSLSNLAGYIRHKTEFEACFCYSDSARELMKVYQYFTRNISNPRFETILFGSLITSAESTFIPSKWIEHCQNLMSHFKYTLTSTADRNFTIQNFIAYMQLYLLNTIPSRSREKWFQNEFERYMFLNGYFPLSEVQLGNGRLDTLPISADSAFICELKQIGFSSSSRITQAAVRRLIKPQQPRIYHERLSRYPNISKDIHIILFAKGLVTFENNVVERHGLRYFFYAVNLSDISPSIITGITIDAALLLE